MNIQIISYHKEKANCEGYNIDCTTFNAPNAFDSYDINIINLQHSQIWSNKNKDTTSLNCINDFRSLNALIKASTKAMIIILMPLNYKFCYYYSSASKQYIYELPIKDMLSSLKDNILRDLINCTGMNYFDFLFGITKTKCNNSEFEADFSFNTSILKPLTEAKTSGDKTTIKIHDRLIFSTLKFDSFDTNLVDFLKYIGLDKTKESVPDWLNTLEFFDDDKQKDVIESSKKEIEDLQQKIKKANEHIESNLYYKRVLIDNGQALVDVVFDMLEKMLNCDLSEFEDKKKEDFLIKLSDVTFVGEIKGITSNVKSENISQVECHCQAYLDRLAEDNITENVKSILIINPFRTKPIDDREDVHINQIQLANKYGCLIITTYELLKLFEAFLNGKITAQHITNVFKLNTGLFKAEDCLKTKEDFSEYKI